MPHGSARGPANFNPDPLATAIRRRRQRQRRATHRPCEASPPSRGTGNGPSPTTLVPRQGLSRCQPLPFGFRISQSRFLTPPSLRHGLPPEECWHFRVEVKAGERGDFVHSGSKGAKARGD